MVKYRNSLINIKRKHVTLLILILLQIIVLCVYLFPILWIVSTSFKTEAQAYSLPPKFLFFKPILDNYKDAFVGKGMLKNFYNSLTVAVGSSVVALIIGTPAAYALSRFRMKRKEGLYVWILSTRMAPPVLAAIPYFILSRKIGLYDTKTILILLNMLMNLSWVVWMMRSFFDDIPVQIDEASMVDGCTRFELLFRIIMPLAKPGLAATVIFCLILSWNEYFFALVMTSIRAITLPAGITSFLTVYGLMWGQMCAAGTVIMLPILIFVFLAQKHLVRGMTMGAVKQ